MTARKALPESAVRPQKQDACGSKSAGTASYPTRCRRRLRNCLLPRPTKFGLGRGEGTVFHPWFTVLLCERKVLVEI